MIQANHFLSLYFGFLIFNIGLIYCMEVLRESNEIINAMIRERFNDMKELEKEDTSR